MKHRQIFVILFLLITFGGVVAYFHHNLVNHPEKIIVVASHLDEASLSLGGFIASKSSSVLLVPFFDQGTILSTTTLIKNIQAILDQNSNYSVKIYGPASFGPIITNPDDELLHEAFMAVASSSLEADDDRVDFYMYENYPGIATFNAATTTTLTTYITNHDDVALTPIALDLSSAQVAKKFMNIPSSTPQNIITRDQLYTDTRCSMACEVVYHITLPWLKEL